MLACAAPLRQFERYNVFKRRLEREREQILLQRKEKENWWRQMMLNWKRMSSVFIDIYLERRPLWGRQRKRVRKTAFVWLWFGTDHFEKGNEITAMGPLSNDLRCSNAHNESNNLMPRRIRLHVHKGQWLWHSWQSSNFWPQRARDRIRSSGLFIVHVYYFLFRKDKSSEKRPRMADCNEMCDKVVL